MSKYKKETVVRTGFHPTYPASPEQAAIYSKVKLYGEPLFVGASAGSGKSTTLVWLMSLVEKWNKGKKSYTSKFMAFNGDIVKDIEPRCPYGVDVSTAHSAGYRALARKFGRLYMPKHGNSACKVHNILKEGWPTLFNPDGHGGKEKGKVFSRLFDTVKLIDMLRLTLTDENDSDAVTDLMTRYNIELDKPDIIGLLPTVFSKIIENPSIIDFVDMMWMAIRLDIELPRFDYLYLDEVQDFNNLMIEYSKRMLADDGVAVLVGDRNQSIYGFAGANPKSVDTLKQRFNADEMPLNTCYRCGKSIIKVAQEIVPEIMAYDGNADGEVGYPEQLNFDMEDGSMILSRRNANLIKPCFELIRQGRKAIIKGKDIGANIISTINKHKGMDMDETLDKLKEYTSNRCAALALKQNSASAIDALQDTLGVIESIAEECTTIDQAINKINMIFSESTKGITLSSIHKSKGLEADHVTIIDYSRVRLSNDKMTDDDRTQEKNLQYVAITRAKKKLDLIL